MHLKDHDLLQLDEEYIKKLGANNPAALTNLTTTLLDDLIEARNRLNQNPSNSSRPSGSMPPWEPGKTETEPPSDGCETEDTPDDDSDGTPKSPPSPPKADESDNTSNSEASKKPGRQPGSQGFGRTQKLTITETVDHFVRGCVICGCEYFPEDDQSAYTAYEVVDLAYGDPEKPGVELINTKHLFYEAVCDCGHHNRETPPRIDQSGDWEGITLTEWRLVGAALASLIVYLSMEMRVSRRGVQLFFLDLFALEVSVGTIQNTIIESAAAVAPLEKVMADDLLKEALMHADETSHPEHGKNLWLWCFISSTTALFYVGYRTSEIFQILTEDGYDGWLMSDGYQVYRHFKKRLRCWAHLIRKARGLRDSLSPVERRYGKRILAIMEDELMQAVYKARKGGLASAHHSIIEEHRESLDILKALCEKMANSKLKKTRELGKEFINDWDAIFRVLELPMLPLTNNEAERRLRHWVLLRRISQGTRSAQGSRALALLASVITTCRIRLASPLHYLRDVIKIRRSGGPAPPLPSIPDSISERLAPLSLKKYLPDSLIEHTVQCADFNQAVEIAQAA